MLKNFHLQNKQSNKINRAPIRLYLIANNLQVNRSNAKIRSCSYLNQIIHILLNKEENLIKTQNSISCFLYFGYQTNLQVLQKPNTNSRVNNKSKPSSGVHSFQSFALRSASLVSNQSANTHTHTNKKNPNIQ